jgi:hypothetical protein
VSLVYLSEHLVVRARNCHAAFYRKFYLLSGQKNVSELQESIVQIFREYFHSDSDIATCYIDFFGNLRMGNYINTEITKDEVILKLTSLLLSNHVIRTPLREERDEKIQQIEEAIQQFDVTLLQDIDKDFVRDNWCYPNRERNLVEDWARKNKMLRSKGEGVLNEKQKELLYYFKENLLFVTITQNCAELIYQIIKVITGLFNKRYFVSLTCVFYLRHSSNWNPHRLHSEPFFFRQKKITT